MKAFLAFLTIAVVSRTALTKPAADSIKEVLLSTLESVLREYQRDDACMQNVYDVMSAEAADVISGLTADDDVAMINALRDFEIWTVADDYAAILTAVQSGGCEDSDTDCSLPDELLSLCKNEEETEAGKLRIAKSIIGGVALAVGGAATCDLSATYSVEALCSGDLADTEAIETTFMCGMAKLQRQVQDTVVEPKHVQGMLCKYGKLLFD